MTWLETQIALLDAATGTVEFAVNWLLQSTLLIAAGLTIGRLTRRRGSAVQSVVYRTTLAAVLVCPIATFSLSLAGVPGWSVVLPDGWTCQRIEPSFMDVETPVPIAPSGFARPGSSPMASPEPFPLDDDAAMAVDAVSKTPTTIAPDMLQAAVPPSVIAQSTSIETTPAETWLFSVHRFGLAALGITASWVLISFLLGARLAAAWRRLARLRRGSLRADSEVIRDCHEMASVLGVSAPDVLRSPYLPSPCLVGLRKPVVLLPDGELSLPVRDALIHELAHLRRRDCHWNLLRRAAAALFFFQPLLWQLSRRIEAAAEEVCDDYVIKYGGDRREYAHRLVDIAELSTQPIAAAGIGIVSLRSLVARRVTRIMDTSRILSTQVGNPLLAVVLVGGLIGTTAVGLVGLEPQPAQAKTESLAGKSDAVQNDEDDNKETDDELATDDGAITVRGIVVDPNGKPVAGATVYLPDDVSTEVQTKRTDDDGRFEIIFDKTKFTEPSGRLQARRRAYLYAVREGYAPGWVSVDELAGDQSPTLRLQRDDVPIRGQVLNLEGQPVPQATIQIWDIHDPHSGSLDGMLETLRDSPIRVDGYIYREMRFFPGRLLELQLQRGTFGRSEEGNPIITADGEGRFEFRGIGRERLARVEVEGRNVESTRINVLTRSEIEDKWKRKTPDEQRRMMLETGGALPQVYTATFKHFAGPSVPITGVVRDRESGEPIAGILVGGWLRNTNNHASATTDENGRYELTGLAVKGTFQQLDAGPEDSASLPYLGAQKRDLTFSAASPLGKDDTDFELARGIVVRGRVTDAQTQQPVKALIRYLAYGDNPHVQELADDIWPYTDGHAGENGEFAIAVLPGPGALAVGTGSSNVPDRYRPARPEEFGRPHSDEGWISTANQGLIRAEHYKAAQFIDFETGEEPLELALTVTPVTDIARVRCIDEEGRPIRNVSVAGHLPWDGNYRPIPRGGLEVGRGAQAYIEIADLGAEARRPVVFRHHDRNVAAILFPSRSERQPRLADLDRDEDGAYRITLTPCGSLTGQLVDANGDPVTDARVELHLMNGSEPRKTDIEAAESPVDEQGRFKLRQLPARGPYWLGGGGDSLRGRVLKRDLQVSAGETIELGTIDVTSKEGTETRRTKAEPNVNTSS